MRSPVAGPWRRGELYVAVALGGAKSILENDFHNHYEAGAMRITALVLGSLAAFGIVACGDDDVGALLPDTTGWPVKKDGGTPAANGGEDRDAGADVVAIPVVDTTAPAVTILSPREGLAVDERRVVVTGTVTDEASIASLTWSTGGDATAITPGADGAFRFDFVPAPGDNAITVVARDAAGNESAITRHAYFGHRISTGNSQGAMLANGKLFTWGRNELGQLGNGTLVGSWSASDDVSPPAMYELDAPELVSIVTRQTFMVALAKDGTLRTWGANDTEQLGYATPADCGSTGKSACGRTPTTVPGVTDAVAIAAGYNHVLALRADGTVLAFGSNASGQLGREGVTMSMTPTAVPGLSNIVGLGATSQGSIAVDATGKVFVWGNNQHGQLATGTVDTTAHPVPVEIPGLTGVASVAGANYTLYARKIDGTVVAWGQNNNGQVGNGTTTTPVLAPTAVLVSPRTEQAEAVALTGVDAISADGFVGVALDRKGVVRTWGLGSLGQLGQGLLPDGNRDLASRSVASPVFVAEADRATFDVVEIENAAGGASFVLTSKQQLFGWGWSFQGSLGGGKTLLNAWAYATPFLVYPQPAK